MLALCGVFAIGGNALAALLFGGIAGILACLLFAVLRDLGGMWNWMIVVGKDTIELQLPRGRSTGRDDDDAVHETVRRNDVDSLQTRLEAYRSLGMVNLNRSYALRCRSGVTITLGEDRALGSPLKSSFLSEAAATLAHRLKVPVRDLGMVEGNSGILGILSSHRPPWDGQALDAEEEARIASRARLTGKLMAVVVMLVFLAVVARILFAAG